MGHTTPPTDDHGRQPGHDHDDDDTGGTIEQLLARGFKVAARHEYRDASNVVRYRVVRLERRNGKRLKALRYEHSDGRGCWKPGRGGPALPYNLPALLASGKEPIHWAEGEKKVDMLAALGVVSSSVATPNGIDFEFARGRICYVHIDKDGAGDKRARALIAALRDIAGELRPVAYDDVLGEGKGIDDWLDLGVGLHELLARCDAAPDLLATPPSARPPAPIWPDLANGRPVRRSQANITAFLAWRGVELSHDLFTMREVATFDGTIRDIDDALLLQLAMEAHRLGPDVPERFFPAAVLDLARRRPFHPVRDYLDGLRWDRKPRLDTWLCRYLGATDTLLTRSFGAKHLLAAVRRIRHPGAKHDFMLVLEGPQGTSKSTAIRILAGDAWFSDALAVGEEAREVIELTSGVWLAEIAELKGLGSREAEHVKTFLSRQSDRARLAYGRQPVNRPRQFVVFGSVNEREYLRDSTGNRRWWPIRCGQIDLDGLRRDRDQLWAEAARREAQGESLELPKELWAAAAEQQEQRLVIDPWQHILEPLFEGKVGGVLTADVNLRLGLDAKHQSGPVGQRITALMTKLGWIRTRLRRNGKREYAWTNAPEGQEPRWISIA